MLTLGDDVGSGLGILGSGAGADDGEFWWTGREDMCSEAEVARFSICTR